jgi:Tfp pilus assembly protein PilX
MGDNMKHEQFTSRQQEAGFVSLFTVIFFMLLISVITIGFLRIMAIEQRQALDNDLSASALAAAESGIEDAKRIILKYMSLPAGAEKDTLQAALTSGSCTDLLTNSTVNSLGINANGSVTGQSALNQYYTCLSINLSSYDYVANQSAGKSEFIPLVSANGTFDRIKISWDLVSNTIGVDGDGRPSNYATSTLLPKVIGDPQSWSAQGYPAYLRVEVYGYPNGSFSRSDINDRTRSVFLIPSQVGAGPDTPINLSTVDPLPHQFGQAKTAVQQVQCQNTPATVQVGNYACVATVVLPDDPGLRGNNNNYFLRVTPLYGATHFKIRLRDPRGSYKNFSVIQPVVDVTGRASDVFRRVQARIRMPLSADLPEYVTETAGDICKNMQISDGSYFQANSCP